LIRTSGGDAKVCRCRYLIADIEAKERVLQTITGVNLRTYEKDIKAIWEKFVESRDLGVLVGDLDELFVDQQLYDEIEEQDEDINALEMIREEDVQLVCYQWFKAE
jgi:hypothetical protein